MEETLGRPQTITEANFEEFVSQDGILVLDWWATWCGPCRAFAPVFEAAAAKHTDMRFGKVDTDAERGLAAAFEIQSIPTLMVFRDRVLLFSQAGALPQAIFEELLGKVKELDMNEVRRQIAQQEAEAPSERPS